MIRHEGDSMYVVVHTDYATMPGLVTYRMVLMQSAVASSDVGPAKNIIIFSVYRQNTPV